ncbi:MAG: asparagine synthase (glutamine-hydrolyzing) [Pseudomonadota bacterium]
MCGIAGILGIDDPVGRHRVAAMVGCMPHRGPDAARVMGFPGAVLGHSRLSIIDLNHRADQPMVSPDGRLAMVFNGEIYNYLELRGELKVRWDFRTDSDTEVLLAAFAAWGERCLDRLNGMFAFCVYDTVTREAFLARDRFGQKPLLLWWDGPVLAFASEAKALLAAGARGAPDHAIWSRYFQLASYDDTAATYFEGISQLLPGECLRVRPGASPERRHWYWLPDRVTPRSMSLGEAAEATRALMVDAARVHMRSDVPVGVMLSGGLDSSTLLASLDLAGALNPSVKCFSVEFGADLSERRWIEPAASFHGLTSRIETFGREDFLASMLPMTWHLEGPIGGLMTCALSQVMRAARQEGYVVLHQGTGPDEAFGGYRNHHNLYLGQLVRSGDPSAEQALAEYAANWGVSVAQARAGGLAELDHAVTAIDGTVPVRPDLLTERARAITFDRPANRFPSPSPLLSSLMDYVQGSKVPRNTRMLDRLSMAFGIELRLPLLDYRLVELGLSLPPALYFHEGRSKGVIREAFKGVMDDDVRLATKRSIQAPQGLWLRSDPMRAFVTGLIESESFASRGFFDISRTRAAWAEFCEGKANNSFFVWQLVNFELWCRVFVDGNPVDDIRPLSPGIWAARPGVQEI